MSILGWSSTSMIDRYAHVIEPIPNDVASRLYGFLWASGETTEGRSPAMTDLGLP